MQILSKFSKIFLAIIFSLTFCHNKLNSKIDVFKIKDLFNVLRPEESEASTGLMVWETSYDVTPGHEELSPIFGALLWETDYIKKLYCLAPESRTQRLIQELFYQQPTDQTIDVTHSPAKVACYLTPQVIGQLVRNVAKFIEITDRDRNYNLFANSITSAISSLIFKDKEGKQIKDNVSAANKNLKGDPLKVFQESIKKLTNNLVGAIKEENKLYPKYHTIFILLSFLWKKENNKQAFLDYFLTVNETIPNLFKAGYDLKDSQNQSQFLSATYPIKVQDYDKLCDTTTNINDFETLCFLLLGFNAYKNPLPPRIDMAFRSVHYKDKTFSDCGETALLNFLDAIFYVQGEDRFDLTLIKKLNPIDKLLQFYGSKYETVTAMAKPDLHNDWAAVVSELSDVEYSQQICDISSGLDQKGINNFFKVLEKLFPDINSLGNTNAPTLEKFNSLLSKAGSKITLSSSAIQDIKDPEHPHQIVSFNIAKPNIEPFQITLKVFAYHFADSYPNLLAGNFDKYKEDIIDQIKDKKASAFKIIKYTTLGKAFDLNIEDVLLNKKAFTLYSLLMQKIDLEKAIRLMEEIALDKYMLDSKTANELLLNFYKNLPKEDYPSQQKAVSILQKKLKFEEYEKILSDTGKITLAISLFEQNLAGKYSEWIKKALNQYKGEEPTLSTITTTILNLDPTKFDKDFLTWLYSWIQKNALPNINGEYYLNKIINTILKLNPATPSLNILYTAIKDSLAKIQNVHWLEEIMGIILNLDTTKTDKTSLNILYTAIKNALPNIKSEKNLDRIINKILSLDPTKIDTTSLNILYTAIQDSLSNIKFAEEQLLLYDIIIKTLSTILKLYPTKIDKTSLDILYTAVKNALLNLKNQQLLSKIINITLHRLDPTKIDKEFLSWLHSWIQKNALPNIKNDPNPLENPLYSTIASILKLDPTKIDDKEFLNFLIDWTSKNLPQLKDQNLDQGFKEWKEKIKSTELDKKDKK